MESPGKIFMTVIWRFQQVGGLVAVVLMCLNLTIPLYEFSGWRFVELGIPKKLDWLIILIRQLTAVPVRPAAPIVIFSSFTPWIKPLSLMLHLEKQK